MRITTLIILAMISFNMNAQKVIEKNLNYNGQTIHVDLPFASDIEVKTWDKNTIYFKADISTEDNKYIDLYKLNIEEGSSKISIEEQPKEVFEKFQDEHQKNNPDKNKKYFNSHFDYEFNYIVYVPKNATFKISSINGNLNSEVIQGKFTADLINGKIDIAKYSGDLRLNTINGEIDLIMKDTKMVAETINGNIYADEKLQIKSEDRHVGQKVEGTYNNGSNSLYLNTINGNIFLRM